MTDEPLILNIEDEPITKAQAKELTVILHNSRMLMKKPRKKLPNFRVFIILFFVFELLVMIEGFVEIEKKKANALTIAGLVITILALVLTIFFVFSLNRTFKRLVSTGKGKRTIVFCKQGIRYNDYEKMDFLRTWDQVAFCRVFNEVICFFPKTTRELLVVMSNDHKEPVMKYLEENAINMMIVK